MTDRSLPIDDEYTHADARITALEIRNAELYNLVQHLKQNEIAAKAEIANLHDALDHEMAYSHSLAQTVTALLARVEALEDRLDPKRNPHE